MNWLRPYSPLHNCTMSGGPMKYQWSLRRMNTVGDGYGGEGCPHYVPGHGCWDALPSRSQGHGEGFQSPSADRPWNDSGEIETSRRVLIESL
eukprot:10547061-Heterocapsa_arctica.AAC.1